MNSSREQSTLGIAQGYVRAGLSVIPIKPDGSKQPSTKWKEYQSRLPTDAELVQWFKDKTNGIGILCGMVSGNLEVIDFDRESETIFFEFRETVSTERPGLFEKLCCCKTPSGVHARYRCEEAIPGNQVLARDETARGEKPFIETRGEGGYGLAPGSPPSCHPSGAIYSHLCGPALTDLATISKEDRDYLISTCRRWNITKELEAKPIASSSSSSPFRGLARGEAGSLSPGDDFDRRASWQEVLEPHGWTVSRQENGLTYWKRPGSEHPYGATTGMRENGMDLLHVFTSSSDFEQEANYGKFRAFAQLNHEGDQSAAARELRKQGYGRIHEKKESTQEEGTPHISTYAELMAKELPPVQWVVPELLPVGLTVLAGKPKLGKSVLAWSLAMSVSTGSKFMGDLETIQGEVLYLALEDSENRLKGRSVLMEKTLPDRKRPGERLHFATTFPRIGAGGLEAMGEWIARADNPKLIIVDVWAKLKQSCPQNIGNVYEWDYQTSAALKSFADLHGVAILLLHHCKKGVAEDALDEVSGSTGLTGCADTIGILGRERTDLEATLLVTGRDLAERRLSLVFDRNSLTWNHQGDAKEVESIKRAQREEKELWEKKIRFLTVLDLADPKGEGVSKNKLRQTWLTRNGRHINPDTLTHVANLLVIEDVIEEVETGGRGRTPAVLWRRKKCKD